MAAKAGKKSRSFQAATREAPLLSSSVTDIKRHKVTIWPEWSDTDISTERWETSKKEDKKSAKSPTLQAQHAFDDPDGRLELPNSLKADSWKRPQEFIRDKIPVIFDADSFASGIDLLIPNNEHLNDSEFIRHCMSQIVALYEMSAFGKVQNESTLEVSFIFDEPQHSWCPWEHIYSLCKAGKGPHMPMYNGYGKYVVKLYWMGCWRKITIDDTIPFDSQGRMLLPSTAYQHELWPMLLTKALMKVASLDYAGGNSSQEFGDMFVTQCLTGWIPESIPLHQSHMKEVWELLKGNIPEWKLPLQEWEKPPERAEVHKEAAESTLKEEKDEKQAIHKDAKEKGKKEAKDKDKGGKDEKKDKKEKGASKGKEKEKFQEEKSVVEEVVVPVKPEVVVFATYGNTSKYPIKVSVLGEMADASEKLRQNGLSHSYSHPVYIAQTRSCSLEPPPPPVIVPSWKLIRPRKKRDPPYDEPVPGPEERKPIQCLEITSPFINYKVSQMPIPTDTHRPKSALERGGTRSRGEGNTIEEGEENAPTPPPPPPPPTVAPEQKIVVPPPPVKEEEVLKEEKKTTKRTTSLKTSRESKSDATKAKAKQAASDVDKLTDPKQEVVILEQPVFGESGGLAPPATDSGTKEETGLEDAFAEEITSVHTSASVWMDYDIFMKCFRSLHIYHKPNTYLCNQRFSDLKNVSSSTVNLTSSKGDKKTQPAVSVLSENTGPIYLFVDNLVPTDIVVSFSVLARWFDPPYNPEDRDRKSSLHSKQSKEKDVDKDSVHMAHSIDERADQKPQSLVPGTLVAEPYSWKSLVTGQPVLRLRTTGTKSAVMRLPPGRHVLRFLANSPLGHHVHMCSTVNFILGDEETVMPQLTNESLRFVENAAQIIANLEKCILAFTDPKQFELAWKGLIKSHCPYLDNKQISKTHHFKIFNDALYSMLRKSIREVISQETAFAWRAFTFDVTSPNILGLTLGSRPEESNVLKKIREAGLAISKQPSVISMDALHKGILGSLDMTGQGSKINQPDERISNETSSKTPVETELRVHPTHNDCAYCSATASHRSSSKLAVKKQSHIDTAEADKSENSASSSYHQPSVDELVAAVKIQKTWRGYYVRKVKAARTAETLENAQVSEILKKCWALIELNSEENALFLLREMLKLDPEIMQYYPFYKDEWNKISYADYKGTFHDQPANSWFLIFRDVFYVHEEMLVVPCVQVSSSTCILHVIDNDTGIEIPRVFQKVAPYVYKKNKKGYSFVAEARSMEHHIPTSIWRMRLIGSLSSLPTTRTGEVSCHFTTKEIIEYYVPNSKNIIFRQSVKVKEDHVVSLQMNTSKRSVYIKLAVLDNEEEVITSVGKGHVVIPVFTFHRNVIQDEFEVRRSGSRASEEMENEDSPKDEVVDENANKTSPAGTTTSTKSDKSASKTKRTESVISSDQQLPQSRNSVRSETEVAERLDDSTPHKYIIQATVLQNSWPLSENSWKFVQTLKEMEKNDLKLNSRERPMSPVKVEKVQSSTSKAKVKGGGKEKTGRDRGPMSSSQNFDMSKPHWTLRVVSDAVVADEIDVKKDTERAEEIKAMKKAWEDAEPGRAAKALQSRLKYLNSHTVKLSQSALPEDISEPAAAVVEPAKAVEPTKVDSTATTTVASVSTHTTSNIAATEAEVSVELESSVPSQTVTSVFYNESETSLTLEPPPYLLPKELLERVDITPFIRKTLPEPLFMNDEIIQELLEKRQKEIAEFKIFREEVEKWREQERQDRNNAKIKQLEQYQALQTALDEARDRVNIPREAIRQRFLEAERLRLQELALLEAALKAEQEASSPKGRKKSAAAAAAKKKK